MIRLSGRAFCIVVLCGTCFAQTDSGRLEGTLAVEGGAAKLRRLSVLGEAAYRSFQVPALPERGFHFSAAGLVYGKWLVTATGFGFCSDPVEISTWVGANSNQNVVTIPVKACTPAQVVKTQTQSRRIWRVRLVKARFGSDDHSNRISGMIGVADGRSPKGARVRLLGVSESDGSAVAVAEPAYTDGQGRFSMEAVQKPDFEGYLLSIQMPGYEPRILSIAVGGSITLAQIMLKPTSLLQAAPQIHMEPMFRYIFVADLLRDLPLPGFRSFDNYALLLPGVFPAAATWARTGPSLSPQIGAAGQFSVNGLRSRENNFVIDGSDTNDEQLGVRRQGFISPTLQTLETIDELQVITAIPDARFGRGIGGQVNALSSSGTQSFHFGAYGLASDSRLNARDYFDASRPTALPANVSVDNRNIAPFAPSHNKEPYTKTITGATAGESIPIWKRRTFLFAAFEHQNLEAVRQFHFATPSASQRQINPAQTALLTPLGSSQRPSVSAPGEAVFSLFPFPNNSGGPYGANTYTTELPEQGSANLYSLKIDQALTAAHSINLRYSRAAEISVLPVTGGALYSGIKPDLRNQNFAMFLNSTFKQNLANNLRASFGATHTIVGSAYNGGLLPSSLVPGAAFLLNAPLLRDVSGSGGSRYQTIGNTEGVTGTVGQLSIAGYSPAGVDVFRFPQTRSNSTWQAADVLTWVRGSHILSAGFDLRFIQLDSTAQRNARPEIVFGGLETPDAVRSTRIAPQIFTPATLAAAGLPSGIFQTIAYGYPQLDQKQIAQFGLNPSFPLHLRNSEVDVFVQDEWRAKPWLSIVPGLRLALAQLPSDADDRILRSFDRAALLQLAADTAASRDCLNLTCGDLASIFANEFPQDLRTTFGANALRADPRIGFAIALPKQTVLRGGWGRYSGQFPSIIITESQSSFPDFLPVNLAGYDASELTNLGNNNYNKSLQFQPPVTSYGVLVPGTLNLVNRYVNGLNSALNPINILVLKLQEAGLDLVQPGPRIKAPYSLQHALLFEKNFERRLTVSAGYVGTMGRHLLRVTTPDLGFLRAALLPSGAPDPLSPRPLAAPLQVPAQPTSAGLFSLARELYEGSANSSYNSLQAQARKQQGGNLTYGASFTWAHAIDDASDFFDSLGTFALPQDSVHRSERGSSAFDSRVRATGYFLWSHEARIKAFAGWDVSGVLSAQSGQPFTINSNIDVNRDGNLTDRPNTAQGLQPGGSDRRTVLTLTSDPLTLLAPRGSDGAVGRNAFRAPPWYDVDLAATARFRLGESSSLLLRAEAFNFLNRANFGIPVRILEAPGFGSAVNTLTPPRSVNAVVRFVF